MGEGSKISKGEVIDELPLINGRILLVSDRCRNFIPSDMIVMILLGKIWYQNFWHTFGAGLICRRFRPILENLTENLFVLFCQSPAPRLITKTCHNFQEFLSGEELCPASYFKEMAKTKIDLHWILDNFYLKQFLIEETMSYITT